jgi:hypothetical protein
LRFVVDIRTILARFCSNYYVVRTNALRDNDHAPVCSAAQGQEVSSVWSRSLVALILSLASCSRSQQQARRRITPPDAHSVKSALTSARITRDVLTMRQVADL